VSRRARHVDTDELVWLAFLLLFVVVGLRFLGMTL
jgi:hypothetical protein